MDGLRALAVLMVVLFHLRVPGMEAGYLGVDVFFVLSGFLITSLLIAEVEEHGRIRLATFWSRRVRRLLPALTVLLLVVALVTWLTATYTERASARGDLLAAVAYVANWRFINTSSYFANTGVESPIQHTWTLAVEEQFYLLWPLVLAGVAALFRRTRLAILIVVLAGIAVSAAVMVWLYAPDSVERAYMGTDARIFEPLLGAAGAVLVSTSRGRAGLERYGRRCLIIGAAVVLAGIVLLPSGASLYFHGGALAFSFATLLIVVSVWVGGGGWVGRVLSWGPIVWIGVVSYGIYLWHWPFILWLGVRDARGGRTVVLGLAAVMLTVGAAALSYYLIERPIRTQHRGEHAKVGWQPRRSWVALAIMPAVLVLVASISIAATEVPPPPPGTPVVMIVGDSVPEQLAVPLERAMDHRGWRMVTAAHGGCSVTGETNSDTNGVALHESNQCAETIVPEQEELVREADPDVVVWWDRWVLYDFLTADGEHVQTGTDRFWALRKAGLEAAVQRLTAGGAKVAFVGIEPPGTQICGGRPIESCADRLRFRAERYHDITTRWNSIMQRYAQRHPDLAVFIDITHEVCHDTASPCDDGIDGVPARPDGTHYGGPGGVFVSNLLASDIAPWMTPGGTPAARGSASPAGASPSTSTSPSSQSRPVVMFVGDSVPQELDAVLEHAMERQGWQMVSAATGGCSVTGETAADTNGAPLHESNQCAEVIVPQQDDLVSRADPDVVVWWDRWVIYDFLTADGEHVRTNTPRFWELRRAGLESAVHRLTVGGATVAFVGIEPPGTQICGGRPIESCADRLRFRAEGYPTVSSRWNSIMQTYAQRHPNLAVYIDITHVVCRDAAVPCDDTIDGVPARPDGTHYGGPGGRFVANLLARDLAPLMEQAT